MSDCRFGVSPVNYSDPDLGEIIGLIPLQEKRYYQNKTQLRYNFGSVYIRLLAFLQT